MRLFTLRLDPSRLALVAIAAQHRGDAGRPAGLAHAEGRRPPPFAVLKTLDTGPITNHVNFARTTSRARLPT